MLAVELPREEVALLFGTLTACGFLILGVLEIMWPTVRRQGPTRPSRSPRPAPMAPRRASMAPTPTPTSMRITPSASRLVTAASQLEPVVAPSAAAMTLPPMEIARVLLDRAGAERDLERRVAILNRAVAGLTRSVEAAPEDEALSQMLTSTRALLWETWERIAMARLAAAMPWSGEILATEVTPVLVRSR